MRHRNTIARGQRPIAVGVDKGVQPFEGSGQDRTRRADSHPIFQNLWKGIKATEKALETCFETDLEWIALKRKFITAEKNFNSLSSLYWACQDKSRKLNSLVNGVTPKEFVEEMIQGKVNGILIKK